MGIFGMLHTSLSGMSAQSDRMSAVADNVANANTTGYKKADTQFSDIITNEGFNGYQSGGVQTHTRFTVDQAGSVRTTGNYEDLSIRGNGFFLVTDKLDGSGTVVLTKAGDFRPDKFGNLRNSAGYYLLSRDDSHALVNVGNSGMLLQDAKVTSNVTLKGILPFETKVVESTPFDPADPNTYSQKTSVTVTGTHGEAAIVEVYFVREEDGWKAYVPKDITVGKEVTGQDFAKPIDLKFNNKGILQGDLTTTLQLHEDDKDTTGSRISIKIDKNTFKCQGSDYSMAPIADGHPAGYFKTYTVDETGHVVLNLTNGQTIQKEQIQLATVESTSNLLSMSGTVFKRTPDVGATMSGYPGQGIFGSIENQQLEGSNADIATELTVMIEAQRTYTSNSKVFQAGAEVMQDVINMIR